MSAQDESGELKPREPKQADASRRFEAELAALTPRAAALDRDRLMFLAGQASLPAAHANQPVRRWAWPAAFSGMTALAASLLVVLAIRPAPRVVERLVRVPVEAPPQPSPIGEVGRHPGEPLARERTGDWLATEIAPRWPRDKVVPGDSYLDIRDRVLAMGIDRWQDDVASSATGRRESSASYHELLDSLLHGGS